MKSQNMIHKGFVVATFAAALAVLPATSKAQEITNAEFSDGPNVAALAQPVASQQTDAMAPSVVPEQTMAIAEFAIPATQAAQAAESVSTAADLEQEDLSQVPAPSPQLWTGLLLLGCVALVTRQALGSAERGSRA